MKKYRCAHCSNCLVNHRREKTEEIIELLGDKLFFFSKFTAWLPFGQKLENFFHYYLLKILIFSGLVKKNQYLGRENIFNRSLVLIDEAEVNGLKIIPLVNFAGQNFNYFYTQIQSREYFFDGLPINLGGKKILTDIIDDKHKLKEILKKHELPYAQGKTFFSRKRGYAYGLKLGFPLVVKPRFGSLSRHVTIAIENEAKLREAIDIAKKYKYLFVVEKYISGDVYRITVVAEDIFAVKRSPASIIGNGKNTIRELINKKNQTEQRCHIDKKDATLHCIEIDIETNDVLAKQKLTLEDVIPIGQKIFVKEKVNLTSGCDLIDATDLLECENKKCFLSLAQALKTDILGIDFICQDISRSWSEQQSAIIECNSLPYIDMHHFPTEGKSRNVAKSIVELILRKY